MFIEDKVLKSFNFVAGIASVLSLCLFVFTDYVKAVVVLSCIVIFLISLFFLIWHYLKQFIGKEHPDDYQKICAIASYETTDGVNGIYETYRFIQSKRIVLDHIDWQFCWSGSRMPKISSDLQDVGEITKGAEGEFDTIKLKLKKPVLFNEATTIHFKAEVDDIDGKASPWYNLKVNMPLTFVMFRITLKNKPAGYNKPAIIQKKRIDSKTDVQYVDLSHVPFDDVCKCYTYNLVNPDVGYYYRIVWEK